MPAAKAGEHGIGQPRPQMHFAANGVFIAILAHGMIGLSLVWDKVLLERPATRNLANYVFWLGIAAGLIHLAANWFYYAALKTGEASETLAVTGGFAPLATALVTIPLLSKPLAAQRADFRRAVRVDQRTAEDRVQPHRLRDRLCVLYRGNFPGRSESAAATVAAPADLRAFRRSAAKKEVLVFREPVHFG